MKAISLHDGIFLFKNFISESYINNLIKIAESYDEKYWYDESLPDHWKGKVLISKSIVDELDIINKKISELFQSYSYITDIKNIQRVVPGGSINYHTDNGSDKDNKYGVILYLNGDFLGGEIDYPDINFYYHPDPGDLIIHEASIYHGVRELISGTRYMLTCFVEGNNDIPASLKKEVLND